MADCAITIFITCSQWGCPSIHQYLLPSISNHRKKKPGLKTVYSKYASKDIFCPIWRNNNIELNSIQVFNVAASNKAKRYLSMDLGTLKAPILKCRLYWCFCLGWCRNFVGSESGQKQSVQLLQNMVYNTTLHPAPPPSTATNCLYMLYVYFRKVWGWFEPERR